MDQGAVEHRQTILAALNRLGQQLVAEESPSRGVPAQLIRYLENHWPAEDRLDMLRRERDAALERGNEYAARLAEIEASGGPLTPPPAGALACARRGCTNALPPPRMGRGAPRRLCLDCGPRRRPLKRPELADSWAEMQGRRIVTANSMVRESFEMGAGHG